jgi:hypothetical protein
MLFVTRVALQVVLCFLLLSLVVAVGSPTTGPAEKAAMALGAVALVLVAVRVREI